MSQVETPKSFSATCDAVTPAGSGPAGPQALTSIIARSRPMHRPDETPADTYNPWSVVHLVFHHLASEGLRPTLGNSGDPGAPAAALLQALGIEPTPEGNGQVTRHVRDHLAQIRAAMLGEV